MTGIEREMLPQKEKALVKIKVLSFHPITPDIPSARVDTCYFCTCHSLVIVFFAMIYVTKSSLDRLRDSRLVAQPLKSGGWLR